MEFLGIGPLELLFIVIIVVVVIGPKDIQKTMRSIGKGLNSIYKSEGWKAFNEVSRELRTLPGRLAQEAELEEIQKTTGEINEAIASVNSGLSAWTPGGQKASQSATASSRPQTPAAAAAATPSIGQPPADVPAHAPDNAELPQVEGTNGAQSPAPAASPAQSNEPAKTDGKSAPPNP